VGKEKLRTKENALGSFTSMGGEGNTRLGASPLDENQGCIRVPCIFSSGSVSSSTSGLSQAILVKAVSVILEQRQFSGF
jgi:hypothetical protein